MHFSAELFLSMTSKIVNAENTVIIKVEGLSSVLHNEETQLLWFFTNKYFNIFFIPKIAKKVNSKINSISPNLLMNMFTNILNI